ncbi:MAG: galactose-1-phosphate uridylyltransferase [Methylobacter sp.]|nr:galactose-1-phosphate uridylyltransferase [Methylobacter sp.]
MHKLALNKPDGRELWLYSRNPINQGMAAPSPFAEPLQANPHLRWHPLRGEWITYAGYRQGRTFMPPPEYNPLAVTINAENPTELPQGNWEVAVFDNRFPSLSLTAHSEPELIVPTRPAIGKCEVVVYTQQADSSLGALPLSHIELLLQVWADRTVQLGQHPAIQFVLPFENRGVEVGTTLHHPHGQIYAYPLIPPVPAGMQQQALEYYLKNGRGLLESLVLKELDDAGRILYQGQHAIAFVPVCARYPYEVWVAPILPVPTFANLNNDQRSDLARALKTVLMKYDGLWNRPFPYLMAWYQAPTDDQPHPECHLHAEFYPPYRTAEKLKYLAGTELAAGFFAMDALPEDKAKELQAVKVDIENRL